MRITNNANLPEVFVEAVRRRERPPGYVRPPNTYSVTDLLNPPRQVVLKRRFADQLVQDASEMVWAAFGAGVHKMLEDVTGQDNWLRETNVETSIKATGGMLTDATLRGRIDYYEKDAQALWDFKTASTWAKKFGSLDGYKDQLELYAYLLGLEHPVKTCNILLLYKDWKHGETRDPSYPQQAVEVVTWEPTGQLSPTIQERIAAIQAAENELPECTDDETWARGECWAVYKGTNKKASRLLDSEEQARKWIGQQSGSGWNIVHRPPVYTRCERYCSVAQFCEQAQSRK